MILVHTYIKQVDSRSYSPLDTYLLNNHNTGLYAKLLLVNAMPNVTTTVSHEVYLHGYDVYGIKMVIASYQTQQ